MTELIANSPTPGSRVALTTLAANQTSTTSLTFTMAAAAPSALQGASGDQFRCVIDSEIVIFDASAVSTTTWTALTRGAEGSTAATHSSGEGVYHDLTAAALQALVSGGSGVQVAGDIGGTTSAPVVVGLQGKPISAIAPTSNQALVWNGTDWTPTTLSSGGTLAGDSDVSITSPANNQGLVYNSTAGKWENAALVNSFNGRTGAVVPASGDYTAAEVGALASTDDLSAIATANATAGDVAMGAHKITGLANGTASTDAAAFGQIPTALPPNGTAGGDLSGTYPNPSVAKLAGIAVTGTPTSGQVLTATSGTAADWQTPTSGSMANPMTTADDMIVGGASGTPARLAIGSDGDVLTVVSGAPTWASPVLSPDSGGNVSGAFTIPSPSTYNQITYTLTANATATMPTAVAGALFQAGFTGAFTLAFASNPTFPAHSSATAALARINSYLAAGGTVWITFMCVDGSTWLAFPQLPADGTIVSIAYAATITPALPGPQNFVVEVGALTGALSIDNPTGSPVDGQKMEIRWAQNGQLSAPSAPVPTTAASGGTVGPGTYEVAVTYVDAGGETVASSTGSITTAAALAAPAAPAPTTATTGGTIAAGTYTVAVTYVDTAGETVASATGTVTTTGATSTITIPSPAVETGATGWYAYVSQAGVTTPLYRQQAAGSPTAIGTALTLTAPPTTTGANPPGTNTTGNESTITIPSPAASGDATGWYAYVSQAGGSTLTRQQAAGSPTAIGTALTLTAPPTNTGATTPASNTSGGGHAITYSGSEFDLTSNVITWPSQPSAASDTWSELFEWNAGTSKWKRKAMV